MRTASFLDFILPVAIASSDHCSHFTNLVLLASCPWGAVIWYWSVWQVFINLSGYFPSCSFFASLTCKLHKRRQEQHWCFLTLTSLSIVAWCTWVVDHCPPLHCLHSPASVALCRSNKAFVLALSSRERCALSNTSVWFVNFWTPKKHI